MNKKIGVIADTITDTNMGKKYFENNGYVVISKPVKETSPECLKFFKEKLSVREAYITELINEIKMKEAKAICIYANSVCAYVDFDKLSKENDIFIITPFHAYQKIGEQYKKPLVFAVTSGALTGIEESIWKVNPNADVRGIYNLDIAVQIEAGVSPKKIIEDTGLEELVNFAYKSGSDCIILGCTHFPYLKTELQNLSKIPVIDPADIILKLLKNTIIDN